MTNFLHTDADLQAGLAQLIAADPRLAPVAEKAGAFSLRRREAGLRRPLRHRLRPATVDRERRRDPRPACSRPSIRSTTTRVRRARTDKLKRLGLSAPKIKSIREIGKAVAQGRIDLTAVGEMDADAAHAALIALHGIGPWSADIYLLFCLGHSDAFPAGDLAVQEAARIAFGLRKRPDAKALDQAGRGLAALARRGGASAVGLLSRGEEARRGAGAVGRSGEEAGQEEAEEEKIHKEIRQWLNSTARGSRRARARRSNSSCSCTATAPTATT